MVVFSPGAVTTNLILSPTLNLQPGRGLRLAVSFDDQAPQIITAVPENLQCAKWKCGLGKNGSRQRAYGDGIKHARDGGLSHTQSVDGGSRRSRPEDHRQYQRLEARTQLPRPSGIIPFSIIPQGCSGISIRSVRLDSFETIQAPRMDLFNFQ